MFVFYDEVGEGQSELICSIVRISANAKTAEEAKRSSRIAGYAHLQDKRGLVTKPKTIFWQKAFPLYFSGVICWL